MKWFSCIHDGNPEYRDMYLQALKSALQNTSLDPYLIYDGSNTEFIADLTQQGVTVIKHVFSLAETPMFQRKDAAWQTIARGTYLRIDIPLICHNIDNYDLTVLYTDVDVLFLTDPVPQLSTLSPKFLAASPEIDIDNWSYFNAGVLLLNIKTMYSSYFSFIKTVYDTFDITGFDQTALNRYYKAERLPPIFNYKPYWGLASDISILHYHGPKPSDIQKYLQTGFSKPALLFIFNRVSKNIWKTFLNYYEELQNNQKTPCLTVP